MKIDKNETRYGGSLSSDAVLQNVQNHAYNVIDSYFDNNVCNQIKIGGSGNMSVRELAEKMQNNFSARLQMGSVGGGSSCTNTVTNPNLFTPPFESPQGERNPILDGSSLPDIHVEPFSKF